MGNWKSGVFCENSANSEVNSEQMMLLEYVAYVAFSELIIFSVEYTNVLQSEIFKQCSY